MVHVPIEFGSATQRARQAGIGFATFLHSFLAQHQGLAPKLWQTGLTGAEGVRFVHEFGGEDFE